MKIYYNEIKHHGIKNQKWGVRNGPPYPLKGGHYTRSKHHKKYTKKKFALNSNYNKRHIDETLNTKSVLSTLSYDKDRTTGTDMFYATHKVLDKHQYNALFNRPIEQMQYDSDGNLDEKKDVARNRALFFNECKKSGYGAILDTNDAIYGAFKATSPVVVFDMDSIVLDKIHQTTANEKKLSAAILVGRRALGV